MVENFADSPLSKRGFSLEELDLGAASRLGLRSSGSSAETIISTGPEVFPKWFSLPSLPPAVIFGHVRSREPY